MTDVTCIGILVADLTAGSVINYPEKGRMVMVDRMQLSTGGNAANTSMVLNKLGFKSALIAKAGNDELGDFVVSSLSKKGIETKGISRNKNKGTGCSMVLNSDDGDRSFISTLGANAAFNIEDIDWDIIKESKLIHVGGALLLPGFDGEPTAKVFKKAQELGITTCMDTVWDTSGRWLISIEECLPYTDLFLPSLIEAQMLTGKTDIKEIAHFFLDAGVKVVGLKMGREGSFVCTKKEEILIPMFDVKTIDTNGAGDAYAAGFIAGWLEKMPLYDIAYLANAIGAMATMDVGPVGGIKKLDEVLDIIKKQK